MAALDDTTAMVASTGIKDSPGVRLGILRGSEWIEGPRFAAIYPRRPTFRAHPRGGQWLAWATADPNLSIVFYRGGQWAHAETLHCAYRDGRPQHYSESPDMSRGPDFYPAVAWATQNAAARSTICVCVPTDSGFGVADEIEFADTDFAPAVTRDLNGDVWLAWSHYYDTVTWIHTFATPTTSRPAVTGGGGRRTISWTLSEPAPETWWAILRSVDDSEFSPVARLRANGDTAMAWTDSTFLLNRPRYRIRRECLDTRYVWVSPDARWPDENPGPTPIPNGPLRLVRASANPTEGQARFEIVGARAGPLRLQVFDTGGRMICSRELLAGGTGQDSAELDLSSPPTAAMGVYFVRAIDSTGATSALARIALIR